MFCELVHWSLKKRDIGRYLVLFCTGFADIEDLKGQDDTSRMDGICDFLWRKFVMRIVHA